MVDAPLGVLYAYLNLLRYARYTSLWGFRTLLVLTNWACEGLTQSNEQKYGSTFFVLCTNSIHLFTYLRW